MVKTYQKKPVTVHARMYDGENGLEIKTFAGASAVEKDGVLYIQSKEGARAAKPGDYIVRGVDGEFFASSPESFEKNNFHVSGDEYQKKPVTVTAVQYDGENFEEVQQFTSFDPSRTATDYDSITKQCVIPRPGREPYTCHAGDYVTRNGGSVYPIDPDIVQQSYEEAEG